jgi:hypothetical protein
MSMKKPFVPEELLRSLCTDKNLEKLFSASAGVWEGYSIREHTLMVMKMFENFWACCIPDEQKKLWRMFLALHDIGKPIAIARFGDKGKQHATTLPIIRQVLKIFYCCDAGSYTEFAGGKYSLDFLFEVNMDTQTMDFSNEKTDKGPYLKKSPAEKFQELVAAASTASIAGSVP